MEQEAVFKGTPKLFRDMVQALSDRLEGKYHHRIFREANPEMLVWRAGDAPPLPTPASEINIVKLHFHGLDKEIQKFGTITAECLPNNHTLLTIQADDTHWLALEASWDLLRSELERRGWIDEDTALQDVGKRKGRTLGQVEVREGLTLNAIVGEALGRAVSRVIGNGLLALMQSDGSDIVGDRQETLQISADAASEHINHQQAPNPDSIGWDAVFEWYYGYAYPTLGMSVKQLANHLQELYREGCGKSIRMVKRHKELYDAEHGTRLH